MDSDLVSDGHLALGPRPRFTLSPRWVTVANVPDRPLPAIPEYECRRAAGPLVVDGRLDEPAWGRAVWSEALGRIRDGRLDGHGTRVALLWDDDGLYVGYRVSDPDVRGTETVHHEQVYVRDDDVEIFVEGDGAYYELGVNPINTVYEFRWTWVEPLVERRDWARIEELLKVPDIVYYTAREGERLGRVGDMGWELPGLRHAVQVQGTLNSSADVDDGWTVEFFLPWAGLAGIDPDGARFPPRSGDVVRMQAYRAQHDRSDPARVERFARDWPGGSPFEGYTWSTMGNGNVHNPERWPRVRFSDEAVSMG